MKIIRGVCPVVWMFLLMPATLVPLFAQQGTKCIALLTELRGEVFVKPLSASEFKKATWGTQLNTGDVLRTSDVGSASLLLANKNFVELGPSSNVTISEDLVGTPAKSKSIRGIDSGNTIDLSGLSLRSTSQGDVVALAGLRSGKADAAVVQVAPRNTKIRSTKPTFSWQANVPVEKYRIKVFGNKGLLWERETDKTSIEYPTDAVPLIPGAEYFWQVEGQALVDSYQSASIGFRVTDQKDLASIIKREESITASFADNPNATSLQFLVGTLYQQHGLYQESITAFESIAQHHPDAPVVHEVLGKLYNDIGLKDKAIAALQKALKLSQER